MKDHIKQKQKHRRLRAQRLGLAFIPSFVPRFSVEVAGAKDEKRFIWSCSEKELSSVLNNIMMSNNQLIAIYDLDTGERSDWRQPLQKKMVLSFQSI